MRTILTGALQGLRHARGTLLLAFAILTLAMTAAVVTFSVVDSVALRPLPYESPHHLVGVAMPGIRPGTVSGLSPADFFLLKDGAQAFVAIAASRPSTPIRLIGAGGSDPFTARRVTTNLFDVLGVKPVAGRLFEPNDERVGGPVAAVLSHELWTRRFGSDTSIFGRTIGFGTEQLQIVGVLPPGVWHPMELSPPDVYVPHVANEAERTNNRVRAMTVVARLKPGIEIDEARTDVSRVLTVPIVIQSLQDQVVGPSKRWLLLVLAAVAIVLMIACANVATLLLTRASTRAREFAIRASLGEERYTLGGSLLVESLAIAFAAGTAAIVLSVWGVAALTAALPPGLLTRVSTIAIDGRVTFAAIVSVIVCAVAFGTAPAWLAGRRDLMSLMNSAGGPIIGGRRVDRTLGAFLVAEVTVVCVLLVATTLVIRSFILITTADLGFDRRNVVTIEYQRDAIGSDAERQMTSETLRTALLARTKSVRGVAAAAISVNASAPLAGASVRYSVIIPGVGETRDDDRMETRIVTPEYFSVMGMRLISGRLFGPEDQSGSQPVMLINEVAAQRFFRGRDPIGEIVMFRGPTTIVGVLRSVRFEGPEGDLRPEMYIPAAQERSRLPREMGSIVFRTGGRATEVGAAVREAIAPILGVEPDQPRLVDEHFRRLTAGRRFNATVMGVFGLIAMALGIIGVYGTVQFLVSQQFREFGLRLALGAPRPSVLRLVLGAALRRVMLGTAIGLMVAWAISGAFRSFVFGLSPTEPGVYAQVALFIAFFGLAAAAIPAARAARLDPAETLRRE